MRSAALLALLAAARGASALYVTMSAAPQAGAATAPKATSDGPAPLPRAVPSPAAR